MFSPKKEQHNAFYRNLDDNVLTDLQLTDLRLIDYQCTAVTLTFSIPLSSTSIPLSIALL